MSAGAKGPGFWPLVVSARGGTTSWPCFSAWIPLEVSVSREHLLDALVFAFSWGLNCVRFTLHNFLLVCALLESLLPMIPALGACVVPVACPPTTEYSCTFVEAQLT